MANSYAPFQLPQTQETPSGQNGRVTFSSDAPAGGSIAGVPGFEVQTGTESDFQHDMLRGNWESGPLSDAFFSTANVEQIQNLIRKGVFDRSQPKGQVIDPQSVDELKIIMRGMQQQYARNLPVDIASQVKDLNEKVVNYAVPHILSAVDHQYFYLNDISHMPVPLARSQHLSRAGTKTLPANPFM